MYGTLEGPVQIKELIAKNYPKLSLNFLSAWLADFIKDHEKWNIIKKEILDDILTEKNFKINAKIKFPLDNFKEDILSFKDFAFEGKTLLLLNEQL